MTAVDFRQASLFDFVPRRAVRKVWDLHRYEGDVNAVRAFMDTLGTTPDPSVFAPFRVCIHSVAWAPEHLSGYFLVWISGVRDLCIRVKIDTGEVVPIFQDLDVSRLDADAQLPIESMEFIADDTVCRVRAGGRDHDIRLVDTDMEPDEDYPYSKTRVEEHLASEQDCGTLAYHAYLAGADRETCAMLASGPCEVSIYGYKHSEGWGPAMDLLLQMAEHCGYDTWLMQDVPDRFEAGFYGAISSCATCRHRRVPCDKKGPVRDLRNESCSFYGRDLSIKGKEKIAVTEEDDA